MKTRYSSSKLKVGDLYFEKKGELKSYRKVTGLKLEKSKCAAKPDVEIYTYIKCDKNGVLKPAQKGVSYVSVVDELISQQLAEIVAS